MFKGIGLQKVALILVLIFIASAAIACVIFFAQFGFDFNSKAMYSGDIKGGVKVDEEKKDTLQGLDRIYIQTVSENINVILADTDEVKAHFYGTYKSTNPDYKPDFTVERSGGSLEIKVEYNHIGVFSFNSNLKLDVYIPEKYAGSLETVSTSGEITADAYTLESFIGRTTSGNIDAKRINAKEARITTTSGETKINGSFEKFEFKSTSGNLESTALTSKTTIVGSTSGEIIIAGAPGDLNAKTVSGNIDLKYTEYSNDIDVTTTSGEVTMTLPENAGFDLDFRSTSGSANVDFPVTVTENIGGHRFKGTVGSGKGTINVVTTSGELQIKK